MNFFCKAIYLFLTLLISSTVLNAQTKNLKPKINQLGFYPTAAKIGVTPEVNATSFYLRNTSSGAIVYEGELESSKPNSPSSESIKIADFSNFVIPGTYVLGIVGGLESYEFEIGNNVFSELSDALIKAFYYNRASTALLEEHAGAWHRALGHPDTSVTVHNSAASANRPTNSKISSPKGWYDAGDFGKYVVPISSSISQLLFAYEEFPEFFTNREFNIPESGDNTPDILDESLWALRWLFTMQDPDDGGVYHKLTTANFVGTVMPANNNDTRYVVQKGTAATYDFAAVMAQAARVYEPFFPSFADSALTAAEKAWDWAITNPSIAYNQGSLNDPSINTGAYGDGGNFSDEKFWASSELYITTKDDNYYIDNGWNNAGVVGWNSVNGLGLFSLVANRHNLTAIGLEDTTAMKNRVKNVADSYVTSGNNSAYHSPFGFTNGHFFWGSNGFAGNIGLASMLAYRTTGESKYYDAAIDVLDYMMGRNPLDQSFVTGFGENPPMKIHHRQSEADNLIDPVPGWVAGGANPGNQSQDCGISAYNSTLSALSYLDEYCSYSTNEITTYWNSPFIYLVAGLEYLTPSFSIENTKTGFFLTPDFNPIYEPGDTVSLAWSLLNFDEVNLLYKIFEDGDFISLATNLSTNDTTYSNFIVPNFPGKNIVFRIESSTDSEAWFQSSFLKIKPSKAIYINEISTSDGSFEPLKRITIEWETISVDSIDIMYRLSSQSNFTILTESYPVSNNSYRLFRVPDAPNDSLIIRLQDSDNDTVFAESEPKEIGIEVSNETESETALRFKLGQNYPNPFNPTTSINYSISKNGLVNLSVFNLQGQFVAELVNESKSEGEYSITWDASNVASGIYYYRLQSNEEVLTRKMMLIK
ncbi:MAG: glycoside hydrolase family 9 protein [Balneolaceae bacterium]